MNTSVVFDARTHKEYRTYGKSTKLLTPYTFTLLFPVPGLGLLEYVPHHGPANQCGWTTKAEAETVRRNAVRLIEDKVQIVLRNADFTEGRGPMVLHRVFKRLEAAELYVSQQEGIYGSPQYRSVHYGVNVQGDLYGSVTWNGYDIRSMEVQ